MSYAFQEYNAEGMARAKSTAVPISYKHSEEIARHLRHKKLQRAKRILTDAIAMKQPIPFTRYNRGMGHKSGMAAGSYPINASKAFLALLESVEANAQAKGLNAGDLIIAHIQAHKAGRRLHGGRHGGRLMKRAHIEVVVGPAKAKVSA